MHHIQIYLSNSISDKEFITVDVKVDTLSVDAILAAVFSTDPVITQLVDLEGEELDYEHLLGLKRLYREAPIKILGSFTSSRMSSVTFQDKKNSSSDETEIFSE